MMRFALLDVVRITASGFFFCHCNVAAGIGCWDCNVLMRHCDGLWVAKLNFRLPFPRAGKDGDFDEAKTVRKTDWRTEDKIIIESFGKLLCLGGQQRVPARFLAGGGDVRTTDRERQFRGSYFEGCEGQRQNMKAQTQCCRLSQHIAELDEAYKLSFD
tara:strand:- start:11948 stop:12421 length:474 start_codon:yes stop_codon:yes gene_type:complete